MELVARCRGIVTVATGLVHHATGRGHLARSGAERTCKPVVRIGEAHMLRTTPPRRRGRPFGRTPLFLVDCVSLDATTLLAKSRGAHVISDQPAVKEQSSQWMLQWTEDGRPQHRTVALAVTTSGQHLGGVRRWWRCPSCDRRCRVLLALAPRAPVACRVCLAARYSADYPARDRRRRLVALFHATGEGGLGVEDQELDALLAPRRRGIRRGRRLVHRAARALIRLHARCDALPEIFTHGGL